MADSLANLQKALGCGDSPSTPGEVNISSRWMKLMIAASCQFDLATIGGREPFFSVFDPTWIAHLLAQLEIDGVFDDAIEVAAKVFAALNAWKTRALEGGGMPAVAIVDAAAFSAIPLNIDVNSFDPNFIPWPAELTYDHFGEDDTFPLYTALDDLGEASVFSQVATDRFWYTCEGREAVLLVEALAAQEGLAATRG